MADRWAPCPECLGLGGVHKFSCSHRDAALAQHEGRNHDWRTFRSNGYVGQLYNPSNPSASYFDASLVSHVLGNLWQGGCKDGVELGSDFAAVVSLYPWEKYLINDGVTRTEVRMLDNHDGVDFADLVKASDAVVEGLKKGPTLVHCQAGLNRSGLVAAFTLMRFGYSAQDAIDLLRKSRSSFVLCNKTFVEQLHSIQHRFDNEPGAAESLRDGIPYSVLAQFTQKV